MINNLIESVRNTDGRFRTLRSKMYPVLRDGDPVMYSGRGFCDFSMELDGQGVRMRCFTGRKSDTRARLGAVSAFLSAIDEPSYNRFVYMEDELLVFDEGGGYSYLDIAVEYTPAGAPMSRAVLDCDAERLSRLAGWVGSFAAKHAAHSLCHGNLTAESIYVDAGPRPVLADFGMACRGDNRDDIAALGIMACVLVLATADRRALSLMPGLAGTASGERLHGLLALPIDGPALRIQSVLQACLDPTMTVAEIVDAVGSLPAGVIPPDGNLSAYLDVSGERGVPEPKAATCAPKAKFKFVGNMHDMLMSAFDGEKWCYIDKHGEVAIPGPFGDAGDFTEGLARVEYEGHYGMIDRDGRFVIEPVFDALEIDGETNRVILNLDGEYGLADRSGRMVTPFDYDSIHGSSEGIFQVQKDGRFGYMTRDGGKLTRIEYDETTCFKEGKAVVSRGGRKYVIGTDGKIIDEIIG
ncbi:MAG: WG repeat-containing protein [Rikenellaceae bacterium]|nr:WG repeat-containing protein [Rikenellaceae bacterium]